jgi:hypothetical protein
MHRAVDGPIRDGSRVSVRARNACGTRTESLRFPRDTKVLTRAPQEQDDLVDHEFGFRYVPRRTS